MESLDKKTLVRVLIRAKNILIKNKWVQNTFAMNEKGHDVDPYDASACSFCLEGAIIRAKHEINPKLGNYLFTTFTDHYISKITNDKYKSLLKYNDSHITTKKEAVETLKNMAAHYKAQL